MMNKQLSPQPSSGGQPQLDETLMPIISEYWVLARQSTLLACDAKRLEAILDQAQENIELLTMIEKIDILVAEEWNLLHEAKMNHIENQVARLREYLIVMAKGNSLN